MFYKVSALHLSLLFASALNIGANTAQAGSGMDTLHSAPAPSLRLVGLRNAHLPPPALALGGDTVMFMAAEAGDLESIVKDAPYSATGKTEILQRLVDGNTIRRTLHTNLYRDSEGRVRREEVSDPGQESGGGQEPRLVFIYDPVTQEHNVFTPDGLMAQRMKLDRPSEMLSGDPATTGGGLKTRVRAVGVLPALPPQPAGVFKQKLPQPQTESLGTRVIENITVEGTRTTLTIPAGAIGNAHPLVTVAERWYSPELQVVVQAQSKDPLMGETVYNLSNIKLAEPPADLFRVPAGYQIQEEPPFPPLP